MHSKGVKLGLCGFVGTYCTWAKEFYFLSCHYFEWQLGFIHILWHCVQSEEMMVCCLLWKNTIYWNLQWNQDMVEDDVYLLFDHCISVWSAACTHSIIAFIRGTFLRLASSSWHPCLYYWWCDVCILRLGASTDVETMATLSFSVYFFLHKKVSNLWAKTFMQAA